MIEYFLWSYFAGLVGAIFMDVTEILMSKFGVSSGVTVEQIGRWFLLMTKGTFNHENIQNTPSVNNEVKAGKIFHYFIAAGGIGLLYPIFLYVINIGFEANHILYGAIFGLSTNIFPWLWLMPTFGWGLFGLKKPTKSNTILSPTISHIMYGIGLGVTLNLLIKYLSTQ